jgi:hypothetical protein
MRATLGIEGSDIDTIWRPSSVYQVTLAYVSSSPIDGSDKRRFFAVLHIPPIDSRVALGELLF